MIGEIGGTAEEDAAAFLKRSRMNEAGGRLHRRPHRPAGPAHGPRRRDHLRRQGRAEGKIEAMRAAGIRIARSPAAMGEAMVEAMGGR